MRSEILLATVASVMFLLSCSPAQARPHGHAAAVSFSGGNGSSMKNAVVVHAPNEQAGVHAEYDYLARHYPGYVRGGQALTHKKQRSYDILDFTTTDGAKHTIYFDITAYFGKLD